WRLGEYVVPAETPVAMSILALHHREDVYPEPHAFRPERFLGHKPGTYTWIPFGGGIRRCLGATLAMAEQRVVLRAIMERVDLEAPDPAPERARQRNVTMIPRDGSRDVVRIARTSRRTFYEHFSDREDCFLALFEATTAEMMGGIASAVQPAAPWEEQVEVAVERYFDGVSARPPLFRSFVRELPALGQAGADRQRAVTER